jgi:hypothetical protein
VFPSRRCGQNDHPHPGVVVALAATLLACSSVLYQSRRGPGAGACGS